MLYKDCMREKEVYKAKYDDMCEAVGLEKRYNRMAEVEGVDKFGNGGIIGTELKSELGTFKKSLQAKQIDKEYYSTIKEKFSHGSENAKTAFNKNVPKDLQIDFDYLGTPKYDRNTKKISMNAHADMNNPRGNGVTWFHEHAHVIDDFAGKLSDDTNIRKLIERDYLEYAKAYGKANNLKTFDKVNQAIGKDLSSMRKHSGVSDIFDGYLNGQIKGCANHSAEYWQKKGNFESEVFAHMFECQFDEVRHAEMQKYFPKTLDYFENKLIKGAL